MIFNGNDVTSDIGCRILSVTVGIYDTESGLCLLLCLYFNGVIIGRSIF